MSNNLAACLFRRIMFTMGGFFGRHLFVCSLLVAMFSVALSSVAAFAQGLIDLPGPDAAPGTHFYILMIHGRHSPCTNYRDTQCPEHEVYGTFENDQANYWLNANKNPHIPTNTNATVLFVQWDAWNRRFDNTDPGGGHNEVRLAIDNWCNFANHQSCRVICHSAGCAAFENWLAKSSYQNGNSLFIGAVIAAGSAAGGSEAADHFFSEPFDIDPADIDGSLTPDYARHAYDHNVMHNVAIRGIAGTTNPYNSSYWGFANTKCTYFPWQARDSGDNPDCDDCAICDRFGNCSHLTQCADDAVALHSGGAHVNPWSYQAVGSDLPLAPVTNPDVFNTFLDHGWWINDHQCVDGSANCHYQGPYSTWGQNAFNPTFRTYRVYHGETKDLAIDEYDACHNLHPRLCP